jgi:hypothetical protein
MTAPTTIPTEGTRPPLLARLKLTEPVRLYCYSLLSAVLLALVAVGGLTGEWSDALLGIAAAVLGVVPGAEFARASVYSPASMVRACYRAANR